MSYINKRGKTFSTRKMTSRQQISDVLSYGQITTTKTNAKIAQIKLEKLITCAKKGGLQSYKRAHSILMTTKMFEKTLLVQHLFTKWAVRYENRNGGYSRILKIKDDIVLLQLV